MCKISFNENIDDIIENIPIFLIDNETDIIARATEEFGNRFDLDEIPKQLDDNFEVDIAFLKAYYSDIMTEFISTNLKLFIENEVITKDDVLELYSISYVNTVYSTFTLNFESQNGHQISFDIRFDVLNGTFIIKHVFVL